MHLEVELNSLLEPFQSFAKHSRYLSELELQLDELGQARLRCLANTYDLQVEIEELTYLAHRDRSHIEELTDLESTLSVAVKEALQKQLKMYTDRTHLYRGRRRDQERKLRAAVAAAFAALPIDVSKEGLPLLYSKPVVVNAVQATRGQQLFHFIIERLAIYICVSLGLPTELRKEPIETAIHVLSLGPIQGAQFEGDLTPDIVFFSRLRSWVFRLGIDVF